MVPCLVRRPRRRKRWGRVPTSITRPYLLLLIAWAWGAVPVSGQAVHAPLPRAVPSVSELARRAIATDGPWGPRAGRPFVRESSSGRSPLRGLAPASPPGAPESLPRFRYALLGGAVGISVSVGMLALLSDTDLADRHDRTQYGDTEERRVQGAALLLIVGSAPIGAVIGAGLADDGLPGEALLAAGLGELIVGGMGALVGIGGTALVGGGPQAQQVGAGVGAGMGAAVGAALGATLSARDEHGALSFRDGGWSVGVPDITIRPTPYRDLPVGARVPLVTARL